MEEHILFFTSEQDCLRQLQQIAPASAGHLLLVLPEGLGRLRVNLFLRLVRRQIAGLALSLTVVSANRQARILAGQIGFASAATLDEALGVAPGASFTSRRRARQSLTPVSFPTLQPLGASEPAPGLPQPTLPAASAATPASPATPAFTFPTLAGPGAHLERLLREGHLPNPAAIPSLEEEAQRAGQEEEARHSRLSYEISDEHTPTLAQEEAEEHEAQIISTILKTSHPLPPPEAPQPPDSLASSHQADGTEHAKETQQQGDVPQHGPHHDDQSLDPNGQSR